MHRVQFWRMVLSCLLAVSLASVAFAQQKDKKAQSPKAPPGMKVERNIAYVENGHERNRLDLYLPEKSTGKLPLVVWIHGGGWMAGSKENPPALWLVSHGFAVASMNYRYSQQAKFPAQIHDAKAAIRFLRANASKYSIDPDHIGVWGESAGGQLVALLGTTAGNKDFEGDGGNAEQSSAVQAVVDWYGPTDFLGIGKDAEPTDSPIGQLIGGPASKNQEKARQASPMTYVNKSAAPMLIMHGDQDKLVPLNQSERYAAALEKAGADVHLEVIRGNGHGGPGFFDTKEAKNMILSFFEKHLKPEGK